MRFGSRPKSNLFCERINYLNHRTQMNYILSMENIAKSTG